MLGANTRGRFREIHVPGRVSKRRPADPDPQERVEQVLDGDYVVGVAGRDEGVAPGRILPSRYTLRRTVNITLAHGETGTSDANQVSSA